MVTLVQTVYEELWSWSGEPLHWLLKAERTYVIDHFFETEKELKRFLLDRKLIWENEWTRQVLVDWEFSPSSNLEESDTVIFIKTKGEQDVLFR